MKRTITAVLITVLIPVATVAQTRNASSLNVMWENDYLVFKGDGTDRYYTNGVRVEYFHHRQKRNFAQRLLLQAADDSNLYGWGIAQHMFTPSRIDIAEVQLDDRPYAGALFAIHSLRSMDREKRMTLTTSVNLGVTGPLSMADEAQTWVHRAIGYTKPEGWHNQVPNDIIVNSLASGIIGNQRFTVLYPLKTLESPVDPEVKGGYPRRGLFAWTAAACRIA